MVLGLGVQMLFTNYNIASCYKWLLGGHNTSRYAPVVWNRYLLPKHSFPLRLVLLQRLLTLDRLVVWYGDSLETIESYWIIVLAWGWGIESYLCTLCLLHKKTSSLDEWFQTGSMMVPNICSWSLGDNWYGLNVTKNFLLILLKISRLCFKHILHSKKIFGLVSPLLIQSGSSLQRVYSSFSKFVIEFWSSCTFKITTKRNIVLCKKSAGAMLPTTIKECIL